jgi:hypothetical protein
MSLNPNLTVTAAEPNVNFPPHVRDNGIAAPRQRRNEILLYKDFGTAPAVYRIGEFWLQPQRQAILPPLSIPSRDSRCYLEAPTF